MAEMIGVSLFPISELKQYDVIVFPALPDFLLGQDQKNPCEVPKSHVLPGSISRFSKFQWSGLKVIDSARMIFYLISSLITHKKVKLFTLLCLLGLSVPHL